MAKRQKGAHGGRREGAGRASYFTGKKATKQFSVVLTRRALQILEAQRLRLKSSRSDFLQALVLLKAMNLFHEEEALQAWTGKMPRPLVLLFNEKGRRTLDALVTETGFSRSNILESLLRSHAREVTADAIAELAA